jgi:hypothetical protein
MFSRRLLAVSFGAVILAVMAAASANALTAERTTYVKFSRSVALPGMQLPAGTYIFERADPTMNRYIVRVLSRDRRKVYTTQVTNIVMRPSNVSNDHGIVLGESAPGQAAPVRAWFPVGDNTGHEFIFSR